MPDPTERIWITGASQGIGAALARAYAARGARLVLSARSEEALLALADEIGRAEVVPVDVADLTSLARAAARIAEGGPLDKAITLAALYDPGKVTEIDPETAARIVTVNLTGAFHFARTAAPLLRDGGDLVLTGSVAGYVGLPQGQIYSASKAGVINLAETLRAELAPRVAVRLISPGFVDTRLTERNDFAMPGLLQPDEAARRILRGLDGRRFEVHFPRRLTWPLKLLRSMSYGLSLRLTARLVR
ncbi:SDR family NAD(P)-dependent oxidoreductase [Salipiger sp. P9]|uniref:SDR family NAD(P)-dependent oxidoreductase n=1 Tax=Salipiger pentaromativorans TaxID=2943193 RepID=UPI0021584534|nr:SDR family NAD(P)-dependent oxidoreductase [Salipiger pentaromativorans]MCR8550307.1 SDR family NAD(P)-dependent oxidoreductase [Salipiger pentaromativorans]